MYDCTLATGNTGTASGKNLFYQTFLLNFKTGALLFLFQQMSPIRLLGKAVQLE